MSDERMEVIVVGGGLAGLSAAYTMARAGMEVLLIERGSYCGAKNVTGGKLCADVLKKLVPVLRGLQRPDVQSGLRYRAAGPGVGLLADEPALNG